jgi:hypothetical protein
MLYALWRFLSVGQNGIMIAIGELEMTGEEAFVANFKRLVWSGAARCVESHKTLTQQS